MSLTSAQQRVAAALAAYESRAIDLDELHQRLLFVDQVATAGAEVQELLSAVDEASDLGRNEREDVAWAASAYWRNVASGD